MRRRHRNDCKQKAATCNKKRSTRQGLHTAGSKRKKEDHIIKSVKERLMNRFNPAPKKPVRIATMQSICRAIHAEESETQIRNLVIRRLKKHPGIQSEFYSNDEEELTSVGLTLTALESVKDIYIKYASEEDLNSILISMKSILDADNAIYKHQRFMYDSTQDELKALAKNLNPNIPKEQNMIKKLRRECRKKQLLCLFGFENKTCNTTFRVI